MQLPQPLLRPRRGDEMRMPEKWQQLRHDARVGDTPWPSAEAAPAFSCCLRLVHANEMAAVAATMPVSETDPLIMCLHVVAAAPVYGIVHVGGPG